MPKQILITRPEIDALETAKILNQKGYESFCESFLKIIYRDCKIPNLEKFETVIFTSRHAVHAFCQNTDERNISVLTVGDKTAEEAEKNNFKNIQSASGDLDDLVQLLSRNVSDKPYLYARGQEVSACLVGSLPKLDIEEVILYHTEKQQEISLGGAEMLKNMAFSHVLFYSKRTAESFVAAIEAHPQKLALFEGFKGAKALCLGSSMVEYLSVLPWRSIDVADKPNQEALLALLESA